MSNKRLRLNHDASGVVLSQPVRSPVHCQLAVRIFMHAHIRLDEVRTQLARRQLQAQSSPLHRVIVADRPVFPDTQVLAPRAHRVGHERRTLLFGGIANSLLWSAM